MKRAIFLLFSLLLFLYLLAVGGHFVAARWWLVSNEGLPTYLAWWTQQLASAPRFALWFFLPTLLYTVLQLHFLQGSVQRE